MSSGCIDARKPKRPKLTPMTGARPRNSWNARSIVPSPPSTTTRSGWSCVISTPAARATSCTRAIGSSKPLRLRTKTFARLTGSPNGCGDPAVDVVGKSRLLSLDEMEDELPVSLRAGQARVYDPDRLASPAQGRVDDLAHDPSLHLRVAHNALLRL